MLFPARIRWGSYENLSFYFIIAAPKFRGWLPNQLLIGATKLFNYFFNRLSPFRTGIPGAPPVPLVRKGARTLLIGFAGALPFRRYRHLRVVSIQTNFCVHESILSCHYHRLPLPAKAWDGNPVFDTYLSFRSSCSG